MFKETFGRNIRKALNRLVISGFCRNALLRLHQRRLVESRMGADLIQ